MFSTTALSVVALAAAAVASPQGIYGPAPGPATTAAPAASSTAKAAAAAPTAPPNSGNQMNVQVGLTGFTFTPNNFAAPNGTTVTFFFPTQSGFEHSVTQSSFDEPCTPLAANGSEPAGFDSTLQLGTQFSITITDDTKPIWFHCKFPLHCGMGMVGAINAPTNGTNTFSNFMAAAQKIGGSESQEPSGTFQPGGSGIGALATASAANTASGSASSSSGSGSSSGASNLAVSGVATVAAAAFGIFALA